MSTAIVATPQPSGARNGRAYYVEFCVTILDIVVLIVNGYYMLGWTIHVSMSTVKKVRYQTICYQTIFCTCLGMEM